MSRRVGSARAANTRESRSSVTTHLLLIVSNRLVDNDCTLVSTCRQPSGCPGMTGRTHDQPEHLMVPAHRERAGAGAGGPGPRAERNQAVSCLLYTSDAADEEDSVDLGGRRIIK